MTPAQFRKIRRHLPNKNRLTGEPGWYVQIAQQLGMSEIWVQRAAKDHGGLHSAELDEAILEMARKGKQRRMELNYRIRNFDRLPAVA